MSKRKNENGEPRVEGEWDAEVRIKKCRDKTHTSMRRKVLKYLAAVFVGIIIGAVACCGRSIY